MQPHRAAAAAAALVLLMATSALARPIDLYSEEYYEVLREGARRAVLEHQQRQQVYTPAYYTPFDPLETLHGHGRHLLQTLPNGNPPCTSSYNPTDNTTCFAPTLCRAQDVVLNGISAVNVTLAPDSPINTAITSSTCCATGPTPTKTCFQCVEGQILRINITFIVTSTATRYDIGVELTDPSNPGKCAYSVFAPPPTFSNPENCCGDSSKGNTQGSTLRNLEIRCTAGSTTYTGCPGVATLNYKVYWDQRDEPNCKISTQDNYISFFPITDSKCTSFNDPLNLEVLPGPPRVIDLSVNKSNPAIAQASVPFIYTIEVSNAGPDFATNVIVTDQLDASLTFLQPPISPEGCNVSATNLLTCTIDFLDADTTKVLEIVVRANSEGNITNTAVVSFLTSNTTNQTDSNPLNDNSTTSVLLVQPAPSYDIQLSKTGPASVQNGQELTFTVVVFNAGPSSAVNFQVVDTLPSNLQFLFDSPGICSGGSTVTCNIVTPIPANESITINITCLAVASGGYTNQVNLVSAIDNGTNTANFSGVITPAADLTIAKSFPAGSVSAGTTTVFSVTVTNNGPDNSTAFFSDTLPDGWTFVDYSPKTGVSCFDPNVRRRSLLAQTTINCNISQAIPVGGTRTVNITVTAPAPDVATNYTNLVALPSAQNPADTSPDDNATTIAQVTPLYELGISKTFPAQAQGGALPGATTTFNITITNAGPSNNAPAFFTDTLPPGWTYVDPPVNANCTLQSGPQDVINCTAGPIPAGGSVVVVITAIAPTSPGNYTNNVVLPKANNPFDNSTANNNASTIATVFVAYDLGITKTFPAGTVSANDTTSFQITVTNGGPSTNAPAVFTDQLPQGWFFLPSSGTNYVCGATGSQPQLVTCNVTNVPANGSVVVTVNVRASSVPGNTTNTAVLPSNLNPNDVTPNDNSTTSAQVLPKYDLGIIKAFPSGNVSANATTTFRITVTNNGPSDNATAVFTDTLPAGWAFLPTPGCTGSGQPVAVQCTVSPVVIGTPSVVLLNVRAPDVPGNYSNSAILPSNLNPFDNTTTNNNGTTTAEVLPSYDLSVKKTFPSTNVSANATTAFQITVTNNGPTDNAPAVVTDTLPAGWVFLPSSGAGYTCSASGQVVTCTLTNVPLNGATVVTVNVRASNVPGPYSNTAVLPPLLNPYDNSPNNNNDTATAQVLPKYDLGIAKTFPAGTVSANDTTLFQITVTNGGPSPSAPAVFTDTLPAGWVFLPSSGTGYSCSASGQVVTCTLTNVPLNGATVVTLNVRASTASGNFSNSALLPSNLNPDDTSLNNNNGTTGAEVLPKYDLGIDKKFQAGTVFANSTTAFQITVTNNGPTDNAPAVFTDQLPQGWVFLSNTGTGTSCSADTSQLVTCTIASVPIGAPVLVTLNVRAATDAPPTTATNTAVLPKAQNPYDSTPDNNNSTATAGVTNQYDLGITKAFPAAAQGGVTADQPTTFVITVTNGGPSTNAPASFVDTLPPGWTYTGFSPDDATNKCAATGQVVQCDITSIPVFGSFEVTLQVTSPPEGGIFFNNVTLPQELNPLDSTPDNNDASVQADVVPASFLTLTKTAPDSPPPTATKQFPFTFVVENAGPSTSTGTTVTDTLPAGFKYAGSDLAAPNGCSASGQTVTCTLPDIPPPSSGSNTVTFKLFVTTSKSVAASNPYTNIANAGCDNPSNPDPTTSYSGDIWDPSLNITKTGPADAVAINTTTQFTITAKSVGVGDVLNAVVYDLLPAELEFRKFISSTPQADQCKKVNNSAIQCTWARIPERGEVKYTFEAKVLATPTTGIKNVATARAQNGGPAFSSASTNVVIPVPVFTPTCGKYKSTGANTFVPFPCPTTAPLNPATRNQKNPTAAKCCNDANLYVRKSVVPTTPEPMRPFTYYLVVGNGGKNTALVQVGVVDKLPKGLIFVSVSTKPASSACRYASGSNTVTCTWASIAPKTLYQVAIVVKGTAGYYTNTATGTSPTDLTPADNSATVFRTQICPPGTAAKAASATNNTVVG